MNLFLISGGLFTGVLFISLTLLSEGFIQLSLYAIGIMHIIYGFFEWKYLFTLDSELYHNIKEAIFITGTIIFWIIYFIIF